MISDLSARGRSFGILAMGLCRLIQRLSESHSSAYVSPHQPREPACARPQRRRHGFDPVEWGHPSNETGLTSLQAWCSPPWRSCAHVVQGSVLY